VAGPQAKLTHHPQWADYALLQAYRPLAGFVARPDHRSPALNTDALGMRESYDAEGRHVDLFEARAAFPRCRVLLGGSAAFGVGATSDRTTIAARLGGPGEPCLNLGVRATTSRGELAVYLALKHLLPPPARVFLFSGANDVLLAATDSASVFPAYGAAFSHEIRGLARAGADQSGWDRMGARLQVPAAASVLAARARRRLARRSGPPSSVRAFPERLEVMLHLLADTLETWSWLRAAQGFELTFVLQPALPWCPRSPTPVERECYEADVEAIPALVRLADLEVYERLRAELARACDRLEITFLDANPWMASSDETLFVDTLHLTDAANALVAARMLEGSPTPG